MALRNFREFVSRLPGYFSLIAAFVCSGAQMISVDRTGTNAGGSDAGELYVVSGDGRYAAFPSRGTNDVANDTNGLSDVFVYDCGWAIYAKLSA
jgi:hypothetical protein